MSVTYLCTAMVWKPPENPNGIITGYDVEVENVTKRVPAKKQFFVTTSTQQQNNALVRVKISSTYVLDVLMFQYFFISTIFLGKSNQ